MFYIMWLLPKLEKKLKRKVKVQIWIQIHRLSEYVLKTTEELQNSQKGREKTAESHVSVKQVAQLVKKKIHRLIQEMPEMPVQSLGHADPMEEGMATHSNILAWRIPWAEEPVRLQSMGSQRIRHDWATEDANIFLSGRVRAKDTVWKFIKHSLFLCPFFSNWIF